MPRLMLLCFSLLIICAVSLTTPAQQNSTETTPAEEQEIKTFIHKLLLRLEETKDFQPLLGEFFYSGFPKGGFTPEILNDENENQDNEYAHDNSPREVVSCINYLQIDKRVFDQFPEPLLKRFQLAILNSFYLAAYGSYNESDQDEEYKARMKELETAAHEFDHGNNTDDDIEIDSTEKLELLIMVLEKQIEFMHEYIKKNPRKARQFYNKNFKDGEKLSTIISKLKIEDNSDQYIESVYRAANLQDSQNYAVTMYSYSIMFCLTREQDSLKIISIIPIGD